MLDNIECKSNGIPVTVDYACRYSLPIDDAREVIDKINDSFESLNKDHDALIERLDDAESKVSRLENALDEWECLGENGHDYTGKTLDSDISELTKFLDTNADSVEFYGEVILLIDKVIQRIKKEGE